MSFTVIDVIRGLGYETENRLDWSIGQLVRDEWVRTNGDLPEKKLGRKTNGRGVHCFANYPEVFRPRATEIISRVLTETHAARRAQGKLFEHGKGQGYGEEEGAPGVCLDES